MHKVYTNEEFKRKNYLLCFKSKEEIVDMLLWYEKENKHNQKIIIKDTSVLNKIREYIKEHENESIYLDCKLYETKVYNDLLEIIDKGIGEDK